tara:strand:- start:801 stop:4118 length:3318 start_codon:yes stop_codon:yes gene_type:complete
MVKKNVKISKADNESEVSEDIVLFIQNKIMTFQEIIRKTILIVQRYKVMDIIGVGEMNVCIQTLEFLYKEMEDLWNQSLAQKITNDERDKLLSKLQEYNTELSTVMKTFGTDTIEDLITVCFGHEFIFNILNNDNVIKYDLIKKYVHPIGYKVVVWKKDNTKCQEAFESSIVKNRIVEDNMIVEDSCNFDCFDLARTSKSFQTKVYGIKVAVHNTELRKSLIICGVVDDIITTCLHNRFIINKMNSLVKDVPDDSMFKTSSFYKFIESLTLKELLIYSTNELYNKFMGYNSQVLLIKQRPISHIVKDFTNNELYMQRLTLIQLLLRCDEPEYQYLAYLLYDLLSNDSNNNIDTQEQTLLFDSLPWSIKRHFRDAMKQTIQYTNNLCNFDSNKIPLEQQICLMKVSDSVKEKAMVKLKEVKAKSEDSGSKARQYLDGLLKIPFNTFCEEPILQVVAETNRKFKNIAKTLDDNNYNSLQLDETRSYQMHDMINYSNLIKQEIIPEIKTNNLDKLRAYVTSLKRNSLVDFINHLNTLIKLHNLGSKIRHSGIKNDLMETNILKFINENQMNSVIMDDLFKRYVICDENVYSEIATLGDKVNEVAENKTKIIDYTEYISKTLDSAVHGHEKAKRQVHRIIGQWINGEQTGYCFGFEGPPGVGKTSLAKNGLADCLKDSNGESRPFSFIALGGSSNGSTLDGHNYTYVGSTWGKIVDILIEHKCMNPIIFIDELDKVSRTENGKEIIGILTHLIDTTQNSGFQDKYFTGIDLDLSKALFIFSYNDVDMIDKVLLDRIHRIKFEHLSLDDKLTVSNKYLIPDILKRMGLEGEIEFTNDVLIYIINKFTCEPGVRKLKEILFEIIGEINLKLLGPDVMNNVDMKDVKKIKTITIDDVKLVYLKDRREIREKEIPSQSKVGVMNGLWANALGMGGLIPIEAQFRLATNKLDLKLTGMQGDVMKESMSVALSLAWTKTPKNRQKELLTEFSDTSLQGIHIHCPEGAVPKDGPSAGTAITVALYSLFNNIKINNKVAITGEMSLQGRVTAIGGLDLKILGGIRAGVDTFLFPKENEKEFNDFKEKYGEKDIVNGISFHMIETIDEALKLALDRKV